MTDSLFSVVSSERERCGHILISPQKPSMCCHFGIGATTYSWCVYRPDIVTMAKPLANGFPIGAIMVRDHVAEKITVGKSQGAKRFGI